MRASDYALGDLLAEALIRANTRLMDIAHSGRIGRTKERLGAARTAPAMPEAYRGGPEAMDCIPRERDA